MNLDIHGKKNQVTALARDASGQILVGDDAFNVDNVETLNITFKGRPSEQNRKLIIDYMRECVRKLVADKLVFGDDRTHFFVGCPSGWIKEVGMRESYERLLRETGINGLTVVAESRAAFMQAKESEDLMLTMGQLKGTVLIVDIGSSTTDFTIVDDLKIIPDDGADLGAALIDKLILSRAIAASPNPDQARELIEAHQPHRARCELACRKAKELYFNSRFHVENPNTPIDIFVRLDRTQILALQLTGVVMREILDTPLPSQGDKTWIQAYRKLLESIRERMAAQELTPKLILMTGGASKMPFTRSMCEQVFPSSAIRSEPMPEFSVSRGLARLGRADMRSADFLVDVDSFCESAEFAELITEQIPILFDAIAQPLAKGLIENAIKPGLRDWATERSRRSMISGASLQPARPSGKLVTSNDWPRAGWPHPLPSRNSRPRPVSGFSESRPCCRRVPTRSPKSIVFRRASCA